MHPDELAAIRKRDFSGTEHMGQHDRRVLLAEVDRLNEALEAARANALRWEAERNGAWKQGYDQRGGYPSMERSKPPPTVDLNPAPGAAS